MAAAIVARSLVRLARVVVALPFAAMFLLVAAALPAGRAGEFHPDWRGLCIDFAMSMLGFRQYLR